MKFRVSLLPALACWPLLGVASSFAASPLPPIDRHALVTRHNPVLRRFDPTNPLSVGNGNFAFTADITGLQTFADAFTNTTPLGTLSQWAWHSFPNPEGWSMDKFHFKDFDVFGRMVSYDDVPGNRQTPETKWLRENPHRLHLGQIGFLLTKPDGSAALANELGDMEQTLDLWSGILRSRFTLQGQPVETLTVCHPDLDMLAVRVVSPLLKDGRVRIEIRFPYGTGGTATADWSQPGAHRTILQLTTSNSAAFARALDQDTYHVSARWTPGGKLVPAGEHRFVLTASREADSLEFVCAFAPGARPRRCRISRKPARRRRPIGNISGARAARLTCPSARTRAGRNWSGASCCPQYLTAIQCSGVFPPQETGLTYNTWEGKFHLEMHWWHSAHFALWNRLPLLERSLGYYQAIFPRPRTPPHRQGYAGARWPKMTDPAGNDSPSSVGPFLIWQQPHPIFYAELCYRARGDRATLEKLKEVVAQTADFMASYPEWQAASNRYVLGPVLQGSQEVFPKDHTLNPTFELTYWRWGLETAQKWRQRLGLPREPKWDHVLTNLAVPALEDGKYLFAETATGTYSLEKKWARDHPSVTAASGCCRERKLILKPCAAPSTGFWIIGTGRTPGDGITRCWPCAPPGWANRKRPLTPFYWTRRKTITASTATSINVRD